MIIKEGFAVEGYEMSDQAAIGVVGRSLDGKDGAAGIFGKVSHAQGGFGKCCRRYARQGILKAIEA